jgi:putative FmdB family regulatory protein
VPIYEYRCNDCGSVNSVFLRTMNSPDPTNCSSCESGVLHRIISRVAYLRSESDKLEQLDPKYFKMVDQALANAPANSDPDFHMNKMVPFSQAKEKGEPYFKE